MDGKVREGEGSQWTLAVLFVVLLLGTIVALSVGPGSGSRRRAEEAAAKATVSALCNSFVGYDVADCFEQNWRWGVEAP